MRNTRRGLGVAVMMFVAFACTKAPPGPPPPAEPPPPTPSVVTSPPVTPPPAPVLPPDAAPPAAAPVAETQPEKKKPDKEPKDKTKGKKCKAGPGECCQPDGTIVKATCDPLDNGPARGTDGWCTGCHLRCLPPAARIATPSGDRAVSTLRAGDAVWTLDATGLRVAQPIERIHTIPALAHVVLRVTLADGRSVVASPGHPTAEARTLAALRPGDPLDGTTIVAITPAPLDGAATWDLLPAGATGLYWADGVLLASTLAR